MPVSESWTRLRGARRATVFNRKRFSCITNRYPEKQLLLHGFKKCMHPLRGTIWQVFTTLRDDSKYNNIGVRKTEFCECHVFVMHYKSHLYKYRTPASLNTFSGGWGLPTLGCLCEALPNIEQVLRPTGVWQNGIFRGKRLHTRNQHLRRHRGFSVAFSNGLSAACSNEISLLICSVQRIVTVPVDFTGMFTWICSCIFQ